MEELLPEDLLQRAAWQLVALAMPVDQDAQLFGGVMQAVQDIQQAPPRAGKGNGRLDHDADLVAVVEHRNRQRVDCLPDVHQDEVVDR